MFEMFSSLDDARFFCHLDLQSAFLQIPISERLQQLFIISTHRGHFKFLKLPFGFCNSPMLMQKMIEGSLPDTPWCKKYFDDLLIFAESKEMLYKRVMHICGLLDAIGFRLNMNKCVFFTSKICFLGWIIENGSRSIDPNVVQAIKELRPPANLTELRQFLGLISHYSASISSLHLYKERFGKLCEKYSHFEWTSETQSDFESVKSAICSSVKLFNSTALTRLSTDFSSFAVGGVLQQYDKDKKCWHAVWHFSKSLNQAQRNWNQSEKECYSIICGLRKFKYFLLGRHFEIHTDHQALLSLINHKDGIPVSTSG
uniref:Reverse transcriptase domain-containing protein n=1 Tax=Strongyloides papillosus TaxID=174720 RepID=A0A0N5B2W3_STREA